MIIIDYFPPPEELTNTKSIDISRSVSIDYLSFKIREMQTDSQSFIWDNLIHNITFNFFTNADVTDSIRGDLSSY